MDYARLTARAFDMMPSDLPPDDQEEGRRVPRHPGLRYASRDSAPSPEDRATTPYCQRYSAASDTRASPSSVVRQHVNQGVQAGQPAVLTVRPVGDQAQQSGRGEALDQALQQRLGLGIDPVQILKMSSTGCARLSHRSTRFCAVGVRWRRCGVSRAGKGLSSGRASSDASSGGMASWRLSSRVRSRPVTFARMV
jgi:hypothetical protein